MGFYIVDNNTSDNTHDYVELATKVNQLMGDDTGMSTLVKLINTIVDNDMTDQNTPASEFDWGVENDDTL